jgi:hypothetical protein
MGRLTTLDLLLVEQGKAVLYCEGQSDFDILRSWAAVLEHPAKKFFNQPFYHPIGGRYAREAREHLFALRAINPDVKAVLLLDGDNRNLPDHEIQADNLEVIRWKRYEIENYLLIPKAITRFLSPDPEDLFDASVSEKAMAYLHSQFPESFFNDPLSDVYQAAVEIPASKQVLPAMLQEAERDVTKNEYYMIAECMEKSEIHPDVIAVLDKIAALHGDFDGS